MVEKTLLSRPGYYIAGFTQCFRHWRTGKVIRAPPGKPFPIWKRIV